MERIGNMIRDGIKPDLTAYTAIEKVMEGGKALIHVTVSRGLKRPYHLIDKGLKPSGVFVRHGVSSVPATDEAIREMIRDSDGTAFDKMRSTNQELTFQYAQDFFSKSRLEFDEVHKHTLGLIDGGRLLHQYRPAALRPMRPYHPLRRLRGDGEKQVQDAQGVLRFHFEAGG